MKKLGQAALEFLSTYGFAFLIILVMIGALSYFGVLNPQNLLPETCTTSPELHCADYRLTNNNISLQLENRLASGIMLVGMTDLSGNSLDCVATPPSHISRGERGQIVCQIPEGNALRGTTGDKDRVSFNLNYRIEGGAFDRAMSVELFAVRQ